MILLNRSSVNGTSFGKKQSYDAHERRKLSRKKLASQKRLRTLIPTVQHSIKSITSNARNNTEADHITSFSSVK